MPGVIFDVSSIDLEEQIKKLDQFDQSGNRHLTAAMGAAVVIGQNVWAKNMTSAASRNLTSMVSGIGAEITPLAPANPATPSKILHHKVINNGNMDVIGIVEPSSQRYVKMGEVGRGPGKHPPVRALQAWAENVMGVPAGKESKKVGRELSHAIAKFGVKPTPVLDETGSQIAVRVQAEFIKAVDKILKDLVVK